MSDISSDVSSDIESGGAVYFGATQTLTWLKRLVVRTLVRPVANVNCTLVTLNRRDFIRLHQQDHNHAGIIVCTDDPDKIQLAERIHHAIEVEVPLAGKLVRVNRGVAR